MQAARTWLAKEFLLFIDLIPSFPSSSITSVVIFLNNYHRCCMLSSVQLIPEMKSHLVEVCFLKGGRKDVDTEWPRNIFMNLTVLILSSFFSNAVFFLFFIYRHVLSLILNCFSFASLLCSS